MSLRLLLALATSATLAAALWFRGAATEGQDPGWTEVTAGVYRSPGPAASYALVDNGEALLIDAAQTTRHFGGVRKVAGVLLTHYHRPVCGELDSVLKQGVPVRAPKAAAEWLGRAQVKKYWQESLPLRTSRTGYLIVPEGFDGIAYDLEGGQTIRWRQWSLEIIEAPGHARAQVAILATGPDGKRLLFCGGALAEPGKLWAPYTTDWDHWTDAGLKPAAQTLRQLAKTKPDLICPSYGAVITAKTEQALAGTAAVVEENAFLKSFERFTKQRLGNQPEYRFLVKEQAESNGSKPWSRVSESLWLTGNTYVLVSRDNACLMVDPWGKRSVEQWAKLQREQKLGPLEVVLFSHAHYDHYDGVYDLPERERFQIWTLDLVALPIAQPLLLRAPFLDARPIRFDRKPRDGETLTWREFRLTFHHLPGQSEFTMGVETTIDGKRCYFTADNFFHQDMYSGSGGWMGLNRSFPPLYAASARKVLKAAPDWVLAEHGGPFEFNAEDFRRRAQWGDAAAQAADQLSLSGQHQHDWNPHHVRVEPLVQEAKPGAMLRGTIIADNRTKRAQRFEVMLEGGRGLDSRVWHLETPPLQEARQSFTLPLPADLPAGRHVWTLRIREGGRLQSADAFLAVDVP